MKLLSENVKPFVKFMMMIAILMSCFSLAALILSTLNYIAPTLQTERTGKLILQAIGSIIMFGVPTLFYIIVFDRAFGRHFRSSAPSNLWIWALILPIASIPLIDLLNLWNNQWHFTGEEMWRQMQQNSSIAVSELLSVKSVSGLLGNIVVLAAVPAIFEELFFRGVLQTICTEWFKNVFLGIIISSAIFSFIHFEIFSFVPRFVLSCLLGTVFVLGKNIFVNILCHFVNNLSSCVFYFLAANGKIEQADSSVYSQTPLFIIISIVVLIFFSCFQIIHSKKQKNKIKS